MYQLGFALVYLGFGAGLVVVLWTLRSLTERSPGPRSAVASRLVAVGAVVATASLWAPWVRWPRLVRPVSETGWEGLDPLSTGMVAVVAACALATAVAVGRGAQRAWLIAAQAACLVLLVVGNIAIQSSTPRGSALAWGAALAFGGAAVALVGLAVAVRSASA